MAPWSPGDPWPSGTPGGAMAPRWGDYVRLWVRAGIAPGATFHMGAHPADRLDAGNVLGGGGGGDDGGNTGEITDRLWVDLSCRILAVDVVGGGTAGQGIFSKADAATLTAEIADPEGIFDPLNPSGPFAYGGRSRLVPGVPIESFAEVVDPESGIVARFPIFTGTADSWGEDWTTNPRERTATVIATDATKIWARFNRPEQTPQGEGDTVAQRIARIVEFFDWGGTVLDPEGGSSRTLQATTLAQPGWELLNRVTDDELGVIYLTPEGSLRWLNRETWADVPDPRLILGCDSVTPPTPLEGPVYDVLLDATPANLDLQLRNRVTASRSGGSSATVESASSITRFGPYEFKRTDLGLASDPQVGEWASRVVELYAFPQVGIADVVFQPGIAGESSADLWPEVLAWNLFSDIVRVLWQPPDLAANHVVDGLLRVVGFRHHIERKEWAVTWQLTAARPMLYSGALFHFGPHANDRLDAGFVLG